MELKKASYQKEVAIKAVLARTIGESTGSFLAVMHSTELSWRGRIGFDYDRAYERWSATSNGIASQINVYFPGSSIYKRWREYEDKIYSLYSLLKYRDPGERQPLLEEIAQYLDDSGLGKRELKVIARFDAPADDVDALLDAYLKRLLGAFRSRAEQLITAVLAADTIVTQPPQRPFPAEGAETRFANGAQAQVDKLRHTATEDTSAAAFKTRLHPS